MTRYGQGRHGYGTGMGQAAVVAGYSQFTLQIALLALLAFLVAAYLVFMNSMTKKSFEISRLESAVSDMQRENRRLEVEIAQRESIASLADQVAGLGMVPTERMEYVTIGSGEVALR